MANPLAKSATSANPSSNRQPLTALEWAGEALERNKPEHFKLWMAEARKRGEVGSARYVQWNDDGSKRTVRTYPASSIGDQRAT